ncbi:MAG TPA: hypothetical protein VLM37_09235 [Fibrobacteraceae bacterium]|nr:hypothetical protein [Fibrobacteraceae bacterium]
MKTHIGILLGLLLLAGPLSASRQMEKLDRGLVAVKVSSGVFLSWRLLATDNSSIGFNVYRGSTLVNSSPITASTNLVDASGTSSSTYSVRRVVNGTEYAADDTVSVLPNFWVSIPLSAPSSGTLNGTSYTYSANDASAGDLDGDGKLDLVLKWDPSNSQDNSKSGYTADVYLDGYTLAGERLWRIDLGPNIRAGAHYTQFLVADFDGDGKAEVMCKTAPGTKDGTGNYLSLGPAANDTDATVYRNSKGYILTGPEYLTVFSGETGKELATVEYVPTRGTVSSWGDSYGNRVDRFLATIAYLDGTKPSAVFQRGYYTRMAITAWDWDGDSLSQRWYYNAATSGSGCYGQGNHNLATGDVDGDGYDEIIEGSCAVDHDGTLMYRTGLGHGDAMHLGDLLPSRDGLEVWEVHEDESAYETYGYELHDAATGEIIWGGATSDDNGRGLAADVDSTYDGYEMWSTGGTGTFSATGTQISTSRGSVNFRVYWDGDLYDEYLDGTTIAKWTGSKSSTLLALASYPTSSNYVVSNNSTKATPSLVADLFGDWREEIVYGTTNADSLIIFTTTTLTSYRLYTLMEDPVYRDAISWQQTAYNQPPHLGFWLADTANWPSPDITLIGSTPTPKISYVGPGASTQIVLLGDTIEPVAYSYANCSGITATGLPSGVSAELNTTDSTITLSGTPTSAGTYTFTLTTTGGDEEADAYTVSGTITVVAKAMEMSMPSSILSLVNAAYPYEGVGAYEEKNAGWIDSGYYNFTNSSDSYALWRLKATSTQSGATLVIRFANGDTTAAARHMQLLYNDSLLGAAPFAKTGTWTTYDSVALSINLTQGLNTLKLSSIGSNGGPNIDEFEFDVAGVTLWNESDTTLEDTSTTLFQSRAYSQSPLTYDVERGLLQSPQEGYAELRVFDLQGKCAAALSRNVSAGVATLAIDRKKLPKGLYWVEIRLNGVRMLCTQMVNLK